MSSSSSSFAELRRGPAAVATAAGVAVVGVGCWILWRLQRQISAARDQLHARIAELETESKSRMDSMHRGTERFMALNRVHALEPSRVQLALLPTPTLDLALPMLEGSDVRITFKMDSDTGVELSGNKVRKLEYLLDAAIKAGATAVITCGGPQSNHARATVAAARRFGLVPHVVLRRPVDIKSSMATGNLFLMNVLGAKITWIDPAEYVNRDEHMHRLASTLRREGVRSYVIPEGGSNALGCWGYIRMLSEILDDQGQVPYDVIVVAAGSSGTLAGLLVGRALLGLRASVDICGIVVGGTVAEQRESVARIVAEFARFHALPDLDVGEYEMVDAVGPGYALTTPEEVQVIREVAEATGVLLDGTYAGKAMHALVTEVKKPAAARRAPFHNNSFCFIHTGGVFGLMAQAEDFVGPRSAPPSPAK